MSTLQIETARVFQPLLGPTRYKAAYGGRGSGKSHFFGEHLIEEALYHRGTAAVCIREIQKSLDKSAKRLIEAKLAKFGLGEKDGFKTFKTEIQTPGDGVISFQGMQDHTADSIKSLEDYRIAWVEEAQTLSATSLSLLRPTIRASGSQIWFSWNPRRKVDPVDAMFRAGNPPTGSAIVKANWSDNPWFNEVLEQERRDCLANEPDQYPHIWEGEYATARSGAYFARHLTEARQQGRVGVVAIDPLMPVKTFWDIGVGDSTVIWVAQFIGQQVRVIDYYEVTGQPLAAHLNWLRAQGYGHAVNYLPHDGAQRDKVTAKRYEDHIREAGFEVQTIANQGRGAAMKRVEEARRLFPSIWFDEKRCDAGLSALGWYHERWDENRNTGLGPEHDWASHAADAFGLMCVAHEVPDSTPEPVYEEWNVV